MSTTATADPVQDQLDTLMMEKRQVERERHEAQGVVIASNDRLRQLAVDERALRGATR